MYDAKTQLPRLLDEVENGETIVITRHGRPIAKLVPLATEARPVGETIAAIRQARRGQRLAGVSIRELIDAGRER